ncbi:MAG: serine--tRNA ligase [Theionarchaea archaeon]|nr:MAG: serine--tRNA ligase [Theionarchaea archaeon DG-70-1]MBU7027931.1 serine--tRNA ligase [Theionarchaea archaeon]
MLDISVVREDPELVKRSMRRRNMNPSVVDEVLNRDSEWRAVLTEGNELRHRKNVLAQEIKELKQKGEDISEKVKETKELPGKIKAVEEREKELREQIRQLMLEIPNILHESVPDGVDDTENVEVKRWGDFKEYDFELKSHVDVMDELNLLDTDRAGKVAGSRFYYLKNEAVLLDMALICVALHHMKEKGFQLMETPCMLNRRSVEGCVDMSAFEDVLYKVEDEDLYLTATSEHTLASYHMDEILEVDDLPLRYAGFSACFRKEAGAHGKDTKGVFRSHQFNKVEQFVFSTPAQSWDEHELMIQNAEGIFQKLEIPYRVVNVCTGDLGGVAAKKYDIEAWMPKQQMFREVVSCSNCTDYQARELNVRYRTPEGNKFVHTLNSTALATSRAIVAIFENFQHEDGSVVVPRALREYMGIDTIKRK